MMSKVKFAAAKELIDEKDYAGARAILKGIDHPTARAWEAKLDAISPPQVSKKSASVVRPLLFIFGGCTVFAIILVVLITRATGTTLNLNGISCDTTGWWKKANLAVVEFLDTATTASKTARASLPSVILELNTIYRKFDQADYDHCVSDIYLEVDLGIKNAVDGYNDFLGQSEVISDIDFKYANQHFANAVNALETKGVYIYDYRLTDTSLIWGGDKPSDTFATRLAAPYATDTPTPQDTRPTLPPEQDLSSG